MSEPSKKYFVKDESLHSADGDMFSYSDISKVLNDIVTTNEPPYNVAVIGKWGLGKSSLINLITERYNKDKKRYFIQEINAWKYEKESLRRVFLKQLWQGLSSKKIYSFEVVRQEISNIIKENIGTVPVEKSKKRAWRFIITSVISVVVTLLAFIGYKCLQALVLNIEMCNFTFWGNVILRYCKNIGTVLFLPIMVSLFKVLIDDYHEKQSNKIELSFPIETTDDYEIFLETKIKDRLKECPNLKIITVIDDLDRLSVDKIVEALDALKAFVGFDRCIFIVPFDDEIIKQALDKRRKQAVDVRIDVVESELILDKLFQFKIYLPPILKYDMQEYALKLAKQEIPGFTKDYCDEVLFQKALRRIIIHPDVSTPRQVKKLLNAFVNNYMIISAREASGKIQKGLLTSEEGTMQIAKMSVLQADFNAFYDLLFLDMSCLEKIVVFHRGDSDAREMPFYLERFFNRSKNNKYALKREYEPLLNFLIRTEKYKVPSIAPFLYLAQDDISIKTGDELQQRAINALTSGNTHTLETLLGESENVAEVIQYYLSIESSDLSTAIGTSIDTFHAIGDPFKSSIASVVIERTLELPADDCQFFYDVSPTNLFDIAKCGDNQTFASSIIEKFIRILGREDWLKKETLLHSIVIITEHWSELTSSAKSALKELSNFCIRSEVITAADLLPCVDPNHSECFLSLWGDPWLKKICSHVDTENDFSEPIIANLCNSFNTLVSQEDVNELIGSIFQLAKYAAVLPVIDDILNYIYDKGKIKTLISETSATTLAISVIGHDFEAHGNTICNILDGLSYVVDEENGVGFDDFFIHFEETDLLDDHLTYCGSHGYFPILTHTIEALLVDIFEDNKNDTLFKKVAGYLTKGQLEQFFERLAEKTKFSANKNYERELALIETIAITKCEDELNELTVSWLSSFNNRFTSDNYYDFVTKSVNALRDQLSHTTIDSYVQTALSNFSSYPNESIRSINQVSTKMSADTFKKVFGKLTVDTPASEFDSALELIMNNNNIRPKSGEDLSAYRNFLVKNLTTTNNPVRVLGVINSSFGRISCLEEMVKNAVANKACDFDVLVNVTGKFLNNSESIEGVSSVVLKICMLNDVEDILLPSFAYINSFNGSDIFESIASTIQDTLSPDSISNLLALACNNLHMDEASTLLVRCLEIAFNKVNQTENSVKYIEVIKQHSKELASNKKKFVDVLISGFKSTTSANLKKSILELVRSLRVKPAFKKELDGDDLEFYNKEID